MAGWVAPVAMAAASVLGSGLNSMASGKMNKRTMKFNEEQSALNRQHAWDMWNATNEYNEAHSSPTYMMQRYKEAGLNPWLVYGEPNRVEASSVGASSHSAPSMQRMDYGIGEAFEKFMMVKMQQKQLQAIDADIASKEASARQSNATAGLTEQQTSQQAELFGGTKTLQGLNIEQMQNTNDKIIKEVESIGIQMDKSKQEIQNMKQSLARGMVEIDNLIKQGKLLDAQNEAQDLANRVIRSTMQSKIDAENAYNNLMSQTKGVGKASISQIPGLILGGLLKFLEDHKASPEEKKSREEWIQKRWQEFKGKK